MGRMAGIVAILLISMTLVHSQGLDYLNPEGQAISAATTGFTANLYHATTEALGPSGGNFVESPFSIGNVLSMLREGASGTTKQQLSDALGVKSFSDRTVSNGYYDILSSLMENKGSIIRIANRIYVSSKGKINSDYTDGLQSKYFTKVSPSNFLMAHEVADDINRWVSEATSGKITDLITPDGIDKTTKAIVINAIYFKGKWLKDFPVKLTRPQPFHLENGNSTMVPFMEQEDVFSHAELPELSASAIAMPYEGGRFSMIVILPQEGTKLKEVEEKLKKYKSFFDIPSRMTKRSIQLVFPKMKLESEIDFTKLGILHKMGIKDAITPGYADFSKITEDEPLQIDSVIQKCYIDITEYGTEAAGATHAKIVPFSIRRSHPFRVTKPFIAYIYDKVTKSVLFVLRKSLP